MTAPSTSAEAPGSAHGARDAAVIAGSAIGGVLAVVVWLTLFYADRMGHPVTHDDSVAPLAWWSQFLLIPLVAFAGAALAPRRVRAVVIAACTGHVLFVLAIRLAFILDHGWFALELVISELVLIALAVGAAKVGRHLALR